jgi:DNA-binding response OmpR family regulator
MERLVVVVDDEPDVLHILCEVLEEAGLQVLCLDHPKQARSLDDSMSPCLFLIDLMLPEENGIRLAEELRAHAFDSVPMIAMSASSDMVRAAWASGLFQDTLSKPFDLDQVEKIVERHIT